MKWLITLPDGEMKDSFFTRENTHLAGQLADVVWNDLGRQYTPEELQKLACDVDAIFTCWNSPKVDAAVLACAPKLKVVTHLAGTVTPYVSEEVYQNGVKVLSGNHFFAESVAEGAIAYMMSGLRRIPHFSHRLHSAHEWPTVFANRGLLDRTIGIVSFGEIAECLVQMLQAFRVHIKVYSRSISQEKLDKYHMQRATLDEIFSTCDIISIHTALNQHTHHMIDKRLLAMIKEDALLVNTARGAVIDEQAMIAELKTGRFSAVLDVYEQEPLPDDSALYDLDNVVLMPHMGGPTIDRRQYITAALLQETSQYIKTGQPPKYEITAQRASEMSNH